MSLPHPGPESHSSLNSSGWSWSELPNSRIVFWIVLLLGMVLAWMLAHTEDDAFITFRYSKHLAEGLGPVWNVSDATPVEGYTNFLWMILMAIPHWLGISVVVFSTVVGILFYGLNLWFSWKLIQRFFEVGLVRLAVLLGIALNYTLLGYATGGLETAMNGALCTGFFYVVIRGMDMISSGAEGGSLLKTLLGISFIAGLMFLSRNDNALFILLGSGWLAFGLMRRGRLSGKNILSLLIPALLIGAGFLLWRGSYYGELLPNTFFAKSSGWEWKDGIRYLGSFFLVY